MSCKTCRYITIFFTTAPTVSGFEPHQIMIWMGPVVNLPTQSPSQFLNRLKIRAPHLRGALQLELLKITDLLAQQLAHLYREQGGGGGVYGIYIYHMSLFESNR